jgi:hypothetical protein
MSPLEKYLLELNKQKQLAESRFNNLNSFQTQLLNSSYAWLLNNLDLQKGVFEVPGDFPSLMNGFVDNILKIADKSSLYSGAINNYITDLGVIRKNIDDFHYDFHEIAKNKPGVKDVQKAVITEVIDQYSENGLNKHFAQPLRDLMFGNILGGMSQKEAKEYLQQYITGGKDESGKLQQYLEQTAQQGVDSYTGAINMQLKKDFDFTGYVISGSLIDTSSKQCIYAINTSDGGYLSFEDWEKVLQIARENKKAKLIDGTTVDNLPLNKLHWGCRHEFTPVVRTKDIKQPPKAAEPPKPQPKPTPAPQPKAEPKPVPKPKAEPVADKKQLEAEIVQTKLVKRADFSKVDANTAKIFADVSKDILSTFNLDPIALKSYKGKGSFRGRANGQMVEIHGTNIRQKEADSKKYISNKPAKIEKNLIRVKDWEDFLKTQKEGSTQYDLGLKAIKELQEANENIKGFSRWTVDNRKEGTVIHEFGHVIQDQRSGFSNGNVLIQKRFKQGSAMNYEAELLNHEWREIFETVTNSPERFKVSEYALYNPQELFAESFTLYYTNRKDELPKGVEQYLNKYLKPLLKK